MRGSPGRRGGQDGRTRRDFVGDVIPNPAPDRLHELQRRGAGNPREAHHMLELRPNCECCDRDLPPAAADARICSFECTFCAGCADAVLEGRCPNCGGELVRRPVRPVDKLTANPPPTRRVVRPAGCARPV